jgi:hypothetical protein
MVETIEDGQRLHPQNAPSLAAFLLDLPESPMIERDESPLRSIDLCSNSQHRGMFGADDMA